MQHNLKPNKKSGRQEAISALRSSSRADLRPATPAETARAIHDVKVSLGGIPIDTIMGRQVICPNYMFRRTNTVTSVIAGSALLPKYPVINLCVCKQTSIQTAVVQEFLSEEVSKACGLVVTADLVYKATNFRAETLLLTFNDWLQA